MKTTDRRSFLKLVGALALAVAAPLDLSHALSIPANFRTGTIADVEHIIFLMQGNRSFDHYFGTMRWVRGFADPRAVRLRSGQPVWHQPNGAGHLLPFRPEVKDLGMTFLPDPPHGWNDTHAAWNSGKYDRWVPNKGVTTMTYHTRKDLPYQHALADAFTICDNYYCSLMGPTDPNRYHMWTGWVGNDGASGGPVITNAEAGYDWSTYRNAWSEPASRGRSRLTVMLNSSDTLRATWRPERTAAAIRSWAGWSEIRHGATGLATSA